MFACQSCKQVYVISGDAKEISSLLHQSSYPCVTPHCRGRLFRVKKKFHHLVEGTHSVPIKSFYRAVNGFGLYEGDPASYADVQKILVGSKVASVKGYDVGQPERTIIQEITLEDGTTLHLDSSVRGACIYFIEKGTPSCLEVFDRERAEDVDGFSGEDREEAGRAPEAEDGDSPGDGNGASAERDGTDVSSVQEGSPVLEGSAG